MTVGNPYKKILEFLSHQGVDFEISEHRPVHTSKEAAEERGENMAQGAKALLLKTSEGDFLIAAIRGDKKLDFRKLKKYLEVKDIRFASPEEVKGIMGCKVGACYPIGNIIGIRVVADEDLGWQGIISFNPGLHDKTITMKLKDYIKTVRPEVVDISKAD